jgi:hypothetical protein
MRYGTFVVFGLLAGWLVFLFAGFLILIGISALLGRMGIIVPVMSGLFIGELLGTIALSLLIGAIIGRTAYAWVAKQKPLIGYISLGIIIILTILSFPSLFNFVAIPDVQFR